MYINHLPIERRELERLIEEYKLFLDHKEKEKEIEIDNYWNSRKREIKI